MNNFEYYNPVKIVFGKNTIPQLPNLIPDNSNILITYGGGSIKKNGVYDQVIKALQNHSIIEFGGIEPNPLYETCMKAVAVAQKNNIDFILAVGGGSVIDGTKFIAAASKFKGKDAWDILEKQSEIKAAIPFGTVITLPATGSEMNPDAIISRRSTNEKLHFGSPLVFPVFSIIDPETNFSLPVRQTVNGIVDTYVHVLEQYVTYDVNSPLQDRQSEAILKTILEIADNVIQDPKNYDARANLCWCATNALNYITRCGIIQDWATHLIGHELTAFYGIDHAQSLAVVLPRLWQNQKENKKEKLLQYGNRVFGINISDEEKAIDETIYKTEEFFRYIGMKTRLHEYNINADEAAEKISRRFSERNLRLGEREAVTPADIKEIIIRSK